MSGRAELRPNVLFITAHDAGRECSVYTGTDLTPNLQHFAEEATVFTRAFAVSPTCSPSRSAMMTGLYPHENGLVGLAHLGFTLDRTDRHLARRFADADYRTLLSGIQHEAEDHLDLGYLDYIGADPREVFRPGIDPEVWDSENADAVVDWLASANEEPWFLSFGLLAPHRPFSREPASQRDLVIDPPAGLPAIEPVRRDAAAFRRSLSAMDTQIGRVLDALENSGMSDHTIVVITTDHGIDFPRYKGTLSDAGLGVMLMVRAPGLAPAVCDDLVSLIDLYPTVIALAALDLNDASATRAPHTAPEPHQARPIRALCPQHPGAQAREWVFSETNYHVAYEPARSVRGERYRLTRRYHDRLLTPANIGDGPSKDVVLIDRPPHPRSQAVTGDVRTTLSDCDYDPFGEADIHASLDESVRRGCFDALNEWLSASADPLEDGTVPAPAGASVAAPDAFSSRSADPAATASGDADE